jgi:15-cis-phytoene synthase
MEHSTEKPQAMLSIPAARRGRSNLVFGLLLLTGERRRDAFLFHDFCRHLDDIADDPREPEDCKRRVLGAWLRALTPGNENLLPGDLREMIIRRGLDADLLRDIVRGLLMDTELNRYGTFDELREYARRVASAVGLASARIFGAAGKSVERYAADLGIALQLTNILRDVAEDAAAGRIYLPLEDLGRFGVTEEEILQSLPTPAMTHLLNHQAERAASWYAKAERSWSELSVNQRRLMRPARYMGAVYHDLLLSMQRDRYDVFAKRYAVSPPSKLALLLRVLMSGN